MTEKLTAAEIEGLKARYGSCFCDCMARALALVTPAALAQYCAKKGYQPFPAPATDANGTRYAYLLQSLGVDPKTKRDVHVVASFGDFPDFPLATAQGLLGAIARLAEFEQRTPAALMADILE